MEKKPAFKILSITSFSTPILILTLGISMSQYLEEKNIEKRRILLIPIGKIDRNILIYLQPKLKVRFNRKVDIVSRLELPDYTYNSKRRQYYSTPILSELSSFISNLNGEKALGIVDVDLYVPELNFVFGEAELGGKVAVISLIRLRQEFYGLPSDQELFLERALKEATHELGHCFGLRHCSDPTCVMHFSNSLADTDRKRSFFCKRCKKILE